MRKLLLNITNFPFRLSIQEAHEAFPDTDLDLIKELYIQSGRNKQLLFNMLMQMAGVEIP